MRATSATSAILLALACLAVLTVGCGGTPTAEDIAAATVYPWDPVPGSDGVEWQDEPADEDEGALREVFARARRIVRLIADGDLDEARIEARALAALAQRALTITGARRHDITTKPRSGESGSPAAVESSPKPEPKPEATPEDPDVQAVLDHADEAMQEDLPDGTETD